MRKSSSVVMGIIIFAFGGMMVAANMALKPLKEYARIGKDVTSALHNLGVIEPESKVYALPQPGGEARLAAEGWGMLIELEPAGAVRKAPGRLRRVAMRALDEAAALYAQGKGKPLEWYELKLVLPEGAVHRSLVRVDEAGRLGRAEPPIPRSWPPPVETALRPLTR